MKEKLLGIICFVKQAKNIYDFRGFQTIRSFGEIIIKNGIDELSKQKIKKTKIKKDKQKKKILLIVQ